MGGGVRAASNLAHAVWLARGASGTAVTMEGVSVPVTFGYPTAASGGIRLAMQDISGFTFAGTTFNFLPTAVTNCTVRYQQPASANNPPTVTVTDTGC